MRILFILSIILVGCSTQKAGIGLNEVDFLVKPYIERKNDSFFLVYQVNTTTPKVRSVIGEKVVNKKYYYFIIGKTSFPEYEHLVRRPVRFTADSFFWLNPDKTEVKLNIVTRI